MQKTAFLFDIERKKCLERKRIEYLLEGCHGTSLNDSSKMRLIDLEKSSSVRNRKLVLAYHARCCNSFEAVKAVSFCLKVCLLMSVSKLSLCFVVISWGDVSQSWSDVMLERDTGRPRGFGFITFADRRAMDDAIREMHGRDFGDRVISVNKAQPKMGGDDSDHGYRGGYSTGSRGGYGGGDRPAGQDECFKCGRSGHWARDCPSAGGRGGGGGLLSSRSRFGGAGDRGDRFGGDRDRYMDDRYDGGRYGERDRFESRDKYGGRDRYASDRYPPPNGDRFAGDRYSGSDRYAQNGYGKDRGYDRDGGPRGGNDRYGSGGPSRNDRSYKNRPGPYDRPSRGGRPSSFDRY
ncbi:hypothetical protein POTOM_029197 [Populus tomentosa]|uniref:Glycine-rich RNA-binding protein RZ1C n=2 Tax=Populus TaxID=3689 RepID=A0A8X7ZCC2_POPTO|nr:hypothetical protein POTOM_029197 [Populus tomentosa]